MKKFALYFSPNENPQFVEGLSADVKRKPNGLKVTIKTGLKSKLTFEGVTIFCEVSEKIKVQ
jgi:hypothetical protein